MEDVVEEEEVADKEMVEEQEVVVAEHMVMDIEDMGIMVKGTNTINMAEGMDMDQALIPTPDHMVGGMAEEAIHIGHKLDVGILDQIPSQTQILLVGVVLDRAQAAVGALDQIQIQTQRVHRVGAHKMPFYFFSIYAYYIIIKYIIVSFLFLLFMFNANNKMRIYCIECYVLHYYYYHYYLICTISLHLLCFC